MQPQGRWPARTGGAPHANRLVLSFLTSSAIFTQRSNNVNSRAASNAQHTIYGPDDRCPSSRIRITTTAKSVLGGRYCRSEEHTSELQSLRHLVCRLLLEKKK